jgi:hypothetical protein
MKTLILLLMISFPFNAYGAVECVDVDTRNLDIKKRSTIVWYVKNLVQIANNDIYVEPLPGRS